MKIQPNILVIGDAMLDTYLYGEVSRVSPEAPIPVVCPTLKEDRPGGAANVACNAATLGAQVTALFLLGSDDQANRLIDKFHSYGVITENIIQDNRQNTISKVRLVGNKQQIARIDMNDHYTIDESSENALIEKFQKLIDSQDIIIISDYDKGICTEHLCQEVICTSQRKGKRVIVDPKGTNWKKYRGAYVITPNLKELNLFSGQTTPNDDSAIEKAYHGICAMLGIRYLLLTRSDKGMTLLEDNTVLHISTQAKEVNDVSGAGDTVVAALAVHLANRPNDIYSAVRFANTAAGIVVGKQGTATVTMEEINQESSEIPIFTTNNMDSLEHTLSKWRADGNTIVTTNGCFDVLHIGHLKLLQTAKSLGDRLIVAINSDASVKRLKGSQRPINNEQDRATMLLSQRMVDAVVIFDPKTEPFSISEIDCNRLSQKALDASSEAPMALMHRIHPDIHVKGGDYKVSDVPEAIFAKRLVLVPFVDGYSTTTTVNRMRGENK